MEAATTLRQAAQNGSAPRPSGEGHGRRLTAAFEALERFPALAEPRHRLLQLVSDDRPPTAELVAAIESDPALSVAVLRLARSSAQGRRRAEASVPAAVNALGSSGVEAIATRVQVFDFFERTPVWDREPERFRLHAVATQRAAERVARELGIRDTDELLVGALLHDVGKLVLIQAYPGYPEEVHREAATPEERLRCERRELGVDHALVGGVLVRRWSLPGSLATIVERHHSEEADGDAAIVRLADMLARHAHAQPVDPGQLLEAARAVSLSPDAVRRIMYELPNGAAARRASEPSPLSNRESEILRGLAEGKVYKEIAADLGLSTSTVRTHLHNTYGKLDAVDRAQAVLIATERGWL